MRKTLLIILAFSVLAISLSSCSMQKKMDTYDFCTRFNSFYEQEILCPSDYYKSSSLNEYNYFIKVNELRTAIVTLQTNENNSVKSVQMTITKDDTELSQEEKQQIIKYFVHLSGVLNSQNQDVTLKEINDLGLNQDAIGFNSYNLTASTQKCKYTVLCSSYIISFYAELIVNQ